MLPTATRITGEGQGGVAGFAKGGAKVFLTDDSPGATLLNYEVNAQVGGKLAQLGARLIDATAKQMAEQFFTIFSDEVQKLVPARGRAGAHRSSRRARPSPVAPPSAVGPSGSDPARAVRPAGRAWLGIAVFVVMVVLWLASIF